MPQDTLQIEIRDKVAYILLNRPERLNSFDMKLGSELYHALHDIKKNVEIRAVVIKGTGKGFCAGGDVKEMHAATNKSQYLRDLTRSIHRCVIEIRTMEKPVIAAVNGAAFGAGLSLVLSCDIIIADKKAKLGTAFIGIGLAPGCGTQFFTKIVGYQRACEYILTSKVFTAKKGEEIGIVNVTVDADRLDETVEEFANKFRMLPPIAVGKAKMLINKSMENDMSTHLELESKTASYAAGTKDFEEGVAAFSEKRKPTFTGK
ncbi:MAG: enoyl-CoA hydratase/isomerase family protein [Candidatus Thermoplasmatota archaeon]|nr:enoyl-CoA hydratase/isomerase family protein [Candidatus Thermoplasmatota archaeon]